MEHILKDLQTGDLAKAQLAGMDSIVVMQYDYQTAQDSLMASLQDQLKLAGDHISDVEQVLTDQIAANNRVNRELRKERRRSWTIGTVLLGALILTNL